MDSFEFDFTQLEELPQQFNWLKTRKANSLAFAERLRNAGLIEYADRIDKCSERLKFQKMRNGFLRFVGTRYCHTRGCIMCEVQKSRKTAATTALSLKKLFSEKPSIKPSLLTLRTPKCSPSEISSTLDTACDAWTRMSNLKVMKNGYYIRLINFDWQENSVGIELKIIALGNFNHSRRYLSKEKLTQMWNQSYRSNNLTIDRSSVNDEYLIGTLCKFTAIYCNPHLERVPDSYLDVAFNQLLGRKMVTGTNGIFSFNQPKPKKEKRHYYPSEVANLRAMKDINFGYIPNPKDDELRDTYLNTTCIIPFDDEEDDYSDFNEVELSWEV